MSSRGRGGPSGRGGRGRGHSGGEPVWMQYKRQALDRKRDREGAGAAPPSPLQSAGTSPRAFARSLSPRSDSDVADGCPFAASAAAPAAEVLERLAAVGDGGELGAFFRRAEGGPYPMLRDLEGRTFPLLGPHAALTVERLQPDPYAPPSQFTVRVADTFPVEFSATPARQTALEDFVLRELWAMGSAGLRGVEVQRPSQHVIRRDAVALLPQSAASGGGRVLELRVRVPIPAFGRRINGRGCHEAFFKKLAPAVARALFYDESDTARHARIAHHAASVDDQAWLRGQLGPAGLVAFVPDGAMLPRASGAHDGPLRSATAVPFAAPPSMRREFVLPSTERTVSGMGIPVGVTCVVGGAFHGKSTLLRALEVGVYNHVPGDGREFCVAAGDSVKIRAEDRRAVAGVDISPFIGPLPSGIDTARFATRDASGSTSQAANIVEALECGATALLIDEDTSATNFMVRDPVMADVVGRGRDPITPFVMRAQALWHEHGVSSVVVAGGTSHFLTIADTVIALDEYRTHDATEKARAALAAAGQAVTARSPPFRGPVPGAAVPGFRTPLLGAPRVLAVGSAMEAARGPKGLRVGNRGVREITLGTESVDMTCVEQLVEHGQASAVGMCLAHLADGQDPAPDVVAAAHSVRSFLARPGLELTARSARVPRGTLAEPRLYEVMAALFRLRTLRRV